MNLLSLDTMRKNLGLSLEHLIIKGKMTILITQKKILTRSEQPIQPILNRSTQRRYFPLDNPSSTPLKNKAMKKCVFVLEDDDDIRELFTILLEEEKYQVKSYPNAKSFLASLEHEQPDLLIMDVMLPDGNGLEICKQLKSREQTAHIPIIMVSAHHDFAEGHEKCVAEAYVAKPFDINELMKKVNQYA
jgi:CheY-like chemotaxis protein